MTAVSSQGGEPASVFVVKGGDPALVDRGVEQLLAELTSSEGPLGRAGDPGSANLGASVAIEEHRAPGAEDELNIGPVLDALFTPAFLAERRIVVLRDAERLDASQAAELASRLGEQFAPNVLVLAVVGKALPAVLAKVVKARAQEIDTSPGASGKARTQWLGEQLQAASVHLDPAARHLLEGHLGEDVSRLHALLDVLTAAYGDGARVSPAELEPFLGEEGGAPPWELTDALDNGDVATAVRAARRLLGPGGRHPFQLLAMLHKHFGAMLRLDGSGVTDPGEAASLLGMSPYPARKVLAQGRRLGTDRIARAVSLVADADLDLRGVVDWPDELVIEVLVARLAQLAHTRLAAPAGMRRPARTS
ncbi:MAG: DNA polymerase III subunit delta [Acidimicrobiales bacterium]